MAEDDPVVVVFRVDREGTVFALFPEVEGAPGYCTCYQHVGQHSSADYGLCIRTSRPATPKEYASLARELRAEPYRSRLTIRRRWMRRRD